MAKEEWGQLGWGGMDDYSKDKSSNDLGRKKFYMKNGETRRLIFLDGMPFRCYFHDTWKLNQQHDLYICLEKNGLPNEHSAKGCPLCDAKDWTHHMGWFSVIDMGLVVYENGKSLLEPHKGIKDPSKSYQFMRKLYGAKRGSQEKPGVLQRLLKRAAANGGDLTGTIWDVSREGELAESVGSDHQFVERIAPADIKRYLLDLGANPENLKTVAPYNCLEEFPIPSYDQMARLARLAGGKRETWSDPKGAGY